MERRSRRPWCAQTCILVFAWCGIAAPSAVQGWNEHAASPPIEELAQKVLAARSWIESASLRITGDYTKDGRSQAFQLAVAVETERWRVDFTRPDRAQVSVQTTPVFNEISCFGCIQADRVVFWSDQVIRGIDRVAVAVNQPADLPAHERRPLVDIRLLGLVPEGAANTAAASLDKYWVNARRKPDSEVITATMENGRRIVRVEWIHERGFPIRFWVSPDQGFEIIRIRIGDTEFLKQMDVELQSVPGVESKWYPRSIRFENYRSGKLVDSEVADIEILSMNRQLPDKTWSLESFPGLQPGTTVRYMDQPPKRDQRWIWDGRGISLAKPIPAAIVPVPQDRSTRVILIWLNICAILMFSAIYLFRRSCTHMTMTTDVNESVR